MMFPVVQTNGRNLFGDLSRDMERFFGQGCAAGVGAMPVDIREDGDTLILDAEVPGAVQDELNLTVENGTLSIALNRKSETEQTGNHYVRERRSNSVTRTFRLPETADLDKIEAQLANGVLTLRIPRKEEAKPRQIQVK